MLKNLWKKLSKKNKKGYAGRKKGRISVRGKSKISKMRRSLSSQNKQRLKLRPKMITLRISFSQKKTNCFVKKMK
jgi:hypothetical protein